MLEPMSRLRVALEIAVVLASAALALIDVPAPLVERWFSTGLYPRIQSVLTPLTNLTPFAWLDILVVVVGATVLVALVRAIRRSWTLKQWQPVLLVTRRLAVTAAALYLCFLGVWGFNYRRVSMNDRLVLDRPVPTPAQVVALGVEAVDRLNALHDEAHRIGWRDDIWRDEPLRAAFEDAQRLLTDAPAAAPGRLKRTMFGTYFRWASVDGMVNPFGLEVLGNPDLLAFERPFVI